MVVTASASYDTIKTNTRSFFFLFSFVVVNEIGATHRGFACGLFRGDEQASARRVRVCGDAESTSLDIGPGVVPIDPAR